MQNYGVYAPKQRYQMGKQGSDHIYFNIEISNELLAPGATTNPFIEARFFENTTQAILQNPSEYYLTISRFSIPGTSIPIFIFDIINNQPNINLSPYIVTLSFGGVDFSTNVIYVPQNQLPLPKPPIPFQDATGYYYVYSYQAMLQMINTTFATSFAALKAAFPAAPPTQPPFLFYDPVTQLISLIVESSYVGAGTIEIYINYILGSRFLNGFPYFANSPIPNPNSKDLRFIIEPTLNNGWVYDIAPYGNPPGTNPQVPVPGYILPVPANTPPYLKITQEYITLQQWNSFHNLVFLSGSLPVQAEYIPQRGTDLNQNSGAVSYNPILTDFQPLLSAAGDARSQLQYYPQGPYRLLDLISTAPLNHIDIQIFWQDQLDRLHPIFLGTTETAYVKLLFIKK